MSGGFWLDRPTLVNGSGRAGTRPGTACARVRSCTRWYASALSAVMVALSE